MQSQPTRCRLVILRCRSCIALDVTWAAFGGYVDGMNRYEYVRSCPTSYVDWLGDAARRTTTLPTAPASSTAPSGPTTATSAPAPPYGKRIWPAGRDLGRDLPICAPKTTTICESNT